MNICINLRICIFFIKFGDMGYIWFKYGNGMVWIMVYIWVVYGFSMGYCFYIKIIYVIVFI